MNNSILSRDKDPMGCAIYDYHHTGKADKLRVLSSMLDEDEMPIDHLFRDFDDMPFLEKKALSMVQGKVLDVGAGAGCHSMVLQTKGYDVTSIDISPLSCDVMKERGLHNVMCVNLFDTQSVKGSYDTILMLMNGTGIAGKISNLSSLLLRLKELLNDGGQVLIDSSDLKYLYENDDGSFDIDLAGDYYGQIDYQMVYGNVKGQPFDWLYVDYPLLAAAAASAGMKAEMVMEGSHYDYLARLTKVSSVSHS